jgi:hypothetical protein
MNKKKNNYESAKICLSSERNISNNLEVSGLFFWFCPSFTLPVIKINYKFLSKHAKINENHLEKLIREFSSNRENDIESREFSALCFFYASSWVAKPNSFFNVHCTLLVCPRKLHARIFHSLSPLSLATLVVMTHEHSSSSIVYQQ